ncbi:hypothetical protein [Natronorubrum sp. FCH18a]|uniref:hypothetical protein n=1 Tax=Natronorubrum sp. FCH18a TaxID=3447018 RepID=UPI003F5149AC
MACTAVRNRYVARSTWTTLSCKMLSVLTAVTVLAFAASLLTVSMGTPDGFVPVAVTSIGVLVLGLALVRCVTYFERHGVPVLESPTRRTAE